MHDARYRPPQAELDPSLTEDDVRHRWLWIALVPVLMAAYTFGVRETRDLVYRFAVHPLIVHGDIWRNDSLFIAGYAIVDVAFALLAYRWIARHYGRWATRVAVLVAAPCTLWLLADVIDYPLEFSSAKAVRISAIVCFHIVTAMLPLVWLTGRRWRRIR